jgi:predicted metal-binding membrane protein
MLWLLPGAQQVGGVTLDINTLVVAAIGLLSGVQLALFGLMAKKYMITTGLLPQTSRFAKLSSVLTLEYGLIVALVLLIIGCVMIARVFGMWQEVAFQNLDPSQSARQTVFGAVTIILAGQVGFTSLFLSILGLNVRTRA